MLLVKKALEETKDEQLILCACGCGHSKQKYGYHDRLLSPYIRGHKTRGKAHYHYKTGRKINSQGYIQISMRDHPAATDNGYILEHRWIMEQHIGRYLLSTEDVHHINANRQDNRIENLQLMTHSAHMSLEVPTHWSEDRRKKTSQLMKERRPIMFNNGYIRNQELRQKHSDNMKKWWTEHQDYKIIKKRDRLGRFYK